MNCVTTIYTNKNKNKLFLSYIIQNILHNISDKKLNYFKISLKIEYQFRNERTAMDYYHKHQDLFLFVSLRVTSAHNNYKHI